MSLDTVSRANRAALLAAKALGDIEPLDEIIIGRDVLELVSSAMYIDPMTVYREYIQNAADAVDEARRQGLIAADAPGQVEITVDAASRSVRIRDNGSGISNSEFARRMAALGGSGKRGTTARGFRGVGRLAGLGYAQELIFRSKTAGDASVAELIWDCRKLKAALREDDGDIESLIRGVTALRKKPASDYPDRFFEVELRGILRIRSDKLMSPAAIEDYLGQVAPVPFAPEFRFGEIIRSALAPFVALGELNITIDGSERPVYRPHRDVIVKEGAKPISFDDVSITTVPSIDGEPAAIVWILHHQYDGALSNSAGIKGLRLRSGNIQVGEHNLLEDLFPEPRFNAWTVGEIHVIDRKVMPNGRRDHFEQNAHYNNLTNHITPLAREIAHICRTSSIRRNSLREVELQQQNIEQTIDVLTQGAIGESERTRRQAVVEDGFQRIARALRNPTLKADDVEDRSVAMDKLRERFETAKHETAPPAMIKGLSQPEQDAFKRFCDLVYECSPNASAAKTLLDKILAKLG
ncbi:molecular chaperone Hsp90 [Rhizobium rhizogenes]|uniref:ATP-binding protein n=1 Tax=Rhizobium rhizogenes TaxID=359 RepID=UPI0015717F31|nr:ATP-binding protein [Rhizobium rhizogenes]NTI23607.1 molecular chaperone Hsp90 [Rhizobium rhizogenes]QTG07120.1 molecular chaperone Hsp90 [Rhizobium rhizogenes]